MTPTKTFSSQLELELAGVELQLLHAPGETEDQLMVWYPAQRTLFPADNIYKAFPNLWVMSVLGVLVTVPGLGTLSAAPRTAAPCTGWPPWSWPSAWPPPPSCPATPAPCTETRRSGGCSPHTGGGRCGDYDNKESRDGQAGFGV